VPVHVAGHPLHGVEDAAFIVREDHVAVAPHDFDVEVPPGAFAGVAPAVHHQFQDAL